MDRYKIVARRHGWDPIGAGAVDERCTEGAVVGAGCHPAEGRQPRGKRGDGQRSKDEGWGGVGRYAGSLGKQCG